MYIFMVIILSIAGVRPMTDNLLPFLMANLDNYNNKILFLELLMLKWFSFRFSSSFWSEIQTRKHKEP